MEFNEKLQELRKKKAVCVTDSRFEVGVGERIPQYRFPQGNSTVLFGDNR